MASDIDISYMNSALAMARRGIGRVWPNPSVGCVIVKNGVVIARARTSDAGRPHAETIALQQAGAAAKGATLYVTLEPCAHHGETPPCVDAVIDSGVSRVVIGVSDVDPRVAGQSIDKMKEAGIDVVENVLEQECKDMNAGFFLRVKENRPFVTLKTACTMDGKIATSSGESQWITGALARQHTHQMRAKHDAILVGSGTVAADDPMLTTRVDGIEHRPVRVVLSGESALPLEGKLVQSANDVPVWLLYKKRVEGAEKLEKAGVILHEVDCQNPKAVLSLLADQGITRVLIEGGARIHGSFIQHKCYDQLLIYRAPMLLGGDGKSFVDTLDIKRLTECHNLSFVCSQSLGQDNLEVYNRKKEA